MHERRDEPDHDRVAGDRVAAGGHHPEHAEAEGAHHDHAARNREARSQRDEHAEQHDHDKAGEPPLSGLGVGHRPPRQERTADQVGLRGDHPQRADDGQLRSHDEQHTDAPGADQARGQRDGESETADEQPNSGVADESPDPEHQVIGTAVGTAVEVACGEHLAEVFTCADRRREIGGEHARAGGRADSAACAREQDQSAFT